MRGELLKVETYFFLYTKKDTKLLFFLTFNLFFNLKLK